MKVTGFRGVFGKDCPMPNFQMYGNLLEYVEQYKYLGVTVTAGKCFSVSTIKPLIKFISAANTILNVQQKSSEPIAF